mgnify:FL=1|jgi:hypothetical protein
MEELKIARAELEAELLNAQSLDFTAEIERKVAEYKAEIEAQAEADKQRLIAEKQADLNALDRIIARIEAKAEAERLALEEAESPELEG